MTAVPRWLEGLHPDDAALIERLADGMRHGLISHERMKFMFELITRGEDPVAVAEAVLDEACA